MNTNEKDTRTGTICLESGQSDYKATKMWPQIKCKEACKIYIQHVHIAKLYSLPQDFSLSLKTPTNYICCATCAQAQTYCVSRARALKIVWQCKYHRNLTSPSTSSCPHNSGRSRGCIPHRYGILATTMHRNLPFWRSKWKKISGGPPVGRVIPLPHPTPTSRPLARGLWPLDHIPHQRFLDPPLPHDFNVSIRQSWPYF